MTSHTKPYCPHCEEIDAVRKVTALYQGGIQKTEYVTPEVWGSKGAIHTSYQHHTAVSQTTISKLLQPPVKPNYRSVFGNTPNYKKWQVPFIVIIQAFSLPVVIVLGIGLPFGWEWVFDPVILISAAILTGIWSAMDLVNVRKYEYLLDEWEYTHNRWQRLYYCARCDSVFFPGNSNVVPVNNLYKYLYNGYEKPELIFVERKSALRPKVGKRNHPSKDKTGQNLVLPKKASSSDKEREAMLDRLRNL